MSLRPRRKTECMTWHVPDETSYSISAELDCTAAPLFGCACCRFGFQTVSETRYTLKSCSVSMYGILTNNAPAKLVCANITSRQNQPGPSICCFCMAGCDSDWRWYAIQCSNPSDDEPYMFYTCSACSMFGLYEINGRHGSECPVLMRCADSCVLYRFDSMFRMND
jgi:hypothetical protein